MENIKSTIINNMEEKLYRSRTDRKICGVCGGIAKYVGCDPTIVRLITACLVLGFGSGILLYLIGAIVIPNEPDSYAQ